MAKIPWWLWLGVGLLVTILSSFVKIPIFIIVGVIFLIIGIAKAVFLFVFKEKEEKQEKSVARAPRANHAYCHRCRSIVARTDYFCRRCGTRLR